MTSALEDPQQFAAIARVDWVVTRSWNRLHVLPHGPWTEEQALDVAHEWMVPGPVLLGCGRIAAMACIPGVGSRMSLPRCKRCCRVTGFPEGDGSPKNDDRCRALLDLDPG